MTQKSVYNDHLVFLGHINEQEMICANVCSLGLFLFPKLRGISYTHAVVSTVVNLLNFEILLTNTPVKKHL